MNQCEMVMKYINDFGSITTFEAFTELGITRLSSRIHDLTNQGVNFKREILSKKNRYGKSVSFMRYSLEVDKMNRINYLGNEPNDNFCGHCDYFYQIVDNDGFETDNGICGKTKKVVTEDGYCGEFREVE